LLSSDAELIFNHPPTQTPKTHSLTHTLSLPLSHFSRLLSHLAQNCSFLLQLKQQFLLLLLVGTTEKHFAYKATKAFRVLPVIFLLLTWL
jgi:hypothetical protein